VARGQRVADRDVVRLLRRHGERPGLQLAVGLVAGVVVIQDVVTPGLAVRERLVRQGRQVLVDDPDARLRRIRAVGVAAAGVPVLGVVVAGARLGVGVLDLVGRRHRGLARLTLVRGREPGAERNVVRAGAALHRLVVVVADRVVLGQVTHDRRVALGHVVEAHRQAALEDLRGRDGAVVIARGVGHPIEQPTLVRGGLLPHLVEAVDRVADVRAVELALTELKVLQVAVEVGHVLGDLERARGQSRRESLVGGVPVLAVAGLRHVRGVGPGQCRIRSLDLRRQRVDLAVGGLDLHRLAVVRAWIAVPGDYAFGQQVVDVLPLGRLVGRVDVVEGVVLADDHHDVLDRRGRGGRAATVGRGRGTPAVKAVAR
jgi:hypothetical protein